VFYKSEFMEEVIIVNCAHVLHCELSAMTFNLNSLFLILDQLDF
jgi:hypothetical protein